MTKINQITDPYYNFGLQVGITNADRKSEKFGDIRMRGNFAHNIQHLIYLIVI